MNTSRRNLNPFRRGRASPSAPPAPLPVPPAPVTRPRELTAQLLKRLEFKVLRRLDGYLFGDYSGLFYGPSLDLAEVREYQPGDEVRKIDWNVTARTGQVHVRQYREEREINAWLIVDLTPSMHFGTRRRLKRDEAIDFTGLVSLLLTRQGNKVGASGFTGERSGVTPLGGGRQQAVQMMDKLIGLGSSVGAASSERDSLAANLEHANRTLRRKALVFVVSDFLGTDDSGGIISSSLAEIGRTPGGQPVWEKALRRLAYKHDVIAVRVSDPAERELPRVGDLRLRDPESAQELWLDTNDPKVRAAHARLVEGRERTIRRALQAARVDLLELSTHRDSVPAILAFTQRRSGRRV